MRGRASPRRSSPAWSSRSIGSNTITPNPAPGVGLANVAEFAAIHGGRAWAEPRTDQGAHLIVELPGETPTGPSRPGGD